MGPAQTQHQARLRNSIDTIDDSTKDVTLLSQEADRLRVSGFATLVGSQHEMMEDSLGPPGHADAWRGKDIGCLTRMEAFVVGWKPTNIGNHVRTWVGMQDSQRGKPQSAIRPSA
jgi:hypothetical protein